ALMEAKASTRSTPTTLLERNLYEFLVDVKTRATGFRYRYEGWLVCSQFKDGGDIECSALQIDLGCYRNGSATPELKDSHVTFTNVADYKNPAERVRSILLLQATTVEADDKYLTALISEEASRSAMLALVKQGRTPENAQVVETYINLIADELGLRREWESGQELIRDIKPKE